MIQTLIGIVIGILICLFIFIVELRLASKGTSIISKVERPVQAQFRAKGAVIQPPDEIAIARQEIIKDNQEKGRETPLEDLYG